LIPAAKTSIQGKKYQSDPGEWAAGTQSTGWQCLKFSMQDPQYFMYSYSSTQTAAKATAATDTFTCTANGDLNGDTNLSTFSLQGGMLAGTGTGLVVNIAPNITETSPDE